MKDIFVSYRRSDVPEHTGRICDYLMYEFGEGRIFKDVESFPAGLDFRPAIANAVGSCKVLLVIIGPGWLNATGMDGSRRLDSDSDFVRLEIAAALDRGVPVVPVLVAGASLPTADQLPKPLKRLAYRQAIVLPDDPYFRPGMKQLYAQLRKHVRPSAGQAPWSMDDGRFLAREGVRSLFAGILGALAAAGALGLAWYISHADGFLAAIAIACGFALSQFFALVSAMDPARAGRAGRWLITFRAYLANEEPQRS